jgi:lysozyme
VKLGKAGSDLIKVYEQGPEGGPALEAYLCPARVWTIGWGHTKDVFMGQHCTEQQAERWFDEDTDEAERAVDLLVVAPLTQNQFDALVSFTYNLGRGNLATSTLLRLLNAKDYTGAANQFPRWNKSKGIVLNGLVSRRADEKALFLTGIGA